MDNPFVDLYQIATSDPLVRSLSDEERRQKRDVLYAQYYTLMVNNVLSQLIAAYQPGVWKNCSDCDHHTAATAYGTLGRRKPAAPITVITRSAGGSRLSCRLTPGATPPTSRPAIQITMASTFIYMGLSQEELALGVKAVLALG